MIYYVCAGDIIQQGLSKVAVYKDESGKAQGFKAACPHLVCCSDCPPYLASPAEGRMNMSMKWPT